jgi:hypothetical protein
MATATRGKRANREPFHVLDPRQYVTTLLVATICCAVFVFSSKQDLPCYQLQKVDYVKKWIIPYTVAATYLAERWGVEKLKMSPREHQRVIHFTANEISSE